MQQEGTHRNKRLLPAAGTALMILCAAISTVLAAYALNGTPLVAVVHGSSMEPAYVQGDASACAPGWSVGEAAVLRDPERDRILVKRVAAAGPCTVTWDGDGKVIVDGEALDEPYAAYNSGVPAGSCDVPAGYLFVLGDNRGASHDSRSFGAVPEDLILGRLWGPVMHGCGDVFGEVHDTEGGSSDADQ